MRLAMVSITVILAMTPVFGTTYGSFNAPTTSGGNTFEAAPVFCPLSSLTVNSVADATVAEADPNTNFGAAPSFEVQSKKKKDARGLVGFALPPVPPGCTIAAATLRVFAEAADTTRMLEVRRLASPWLEATVSWNSQPAAAGPVSSAPAMAGWVSFDVTAQVLAMYAGANEGFVIADGAEGGKGAAATQVFGSKEGASPPELIVTIQ